MPSCVNCKWFTGDATTIIGENGTKTYLICRTEIGFEAVEERLALDENSKCDLYVEQDISNNVAKKP